MPTFFFFQEEKNDVNKNTRKKVEDKNQDIFPESLDFCNDNFHVIGFYHKRRLSGSLFH